MKGADLALEGKGCLDIGLYMMVAVSVVVVAAGIAAGLGIRDVFRLGAVGGVEVGIVARVAAVAVPKGCPFARSKKIANEKEAVIGKGAVKPVGET